MDVDLIPADYRRYMEQRKRLSRFFVLLGLLAVVLLSGWLWLRWEMARETQIADQLKAAEQLVLEQRGQLDRLQAEKLTLTERLTRLRQVRGGPPLGSILTLLATAIDPSAWVEEVSFVRSSDPAKAVANQGQIPTGGRQRAQADATLAIRGKALHLQAQTAFVRNLAASPLVTDVRILTSAARSYSFGSMVEFSLSVLLAEAEESP